MSVQPLCAVAHQRQTLFRCPYSPCVQSRINVRLSSGVRTAPVCSRASTADSVFVQPPWALAYINVRLCIRTALVYNCTHQRRTLYPYSPRVQLHASTSDSVSVQPPWAIARANTVSTLKIPTSGSSYIPLLARTRKNTAHTGRNRQSPQPKNRGGEGKYRFFLFFPCS